jgi:ribose 5-phosphate isomerase B
VPTLGESSSCASLRRCAVTCTGCRATTLAAVSKTVGASVAANKVNGARAALCHDDYSARQGVEDDDMNVLCLGARIIGAELAKEVVAAFLAAAFSGAERHVRRLNKVKGIEKEFMKIE